MSVPASPEAVRTEIRAERDRLVEAVERLRSEVMRAKRFEHVRLPVVAGVLAAGFVVAGGIGATVRLLALRGERRREEERSSLIRLLRRA